MFYFADKQIRQVFTTKLLHTLIFETLLPFQITVFLILKTVNSSHCCHVWMLGSQPSGHLLDPVFHPP